MLVVHLKRWKIPEPAAAKAKSVIPCDRAVIDFQLTDLQPSRLREQISQMPQKRAPLRADQRAYPLAGEKARDLCRDDGFHAGSNLLCFRQVNNLDCAEIGESLQRALLAAFCREVLQERFPLFFAAQFNHATVVGGARGYVEALRPGRGGQAVERRRVSRHV